MDRRTLLKRLALVPFLQILWPIQAQTKEPLSLAHRVRPSDPSWPTSANWGKLKEQVGGNLIKVQSPFDAFKSSTDSPSYQELLKNLHNPYFVGDEPALTQGSGWADAWTTAPSAYAVAARNSADVANAVNFARQHNLRLVVKGGGHSYQGTSNSADSLLIWTRALNKITMHDAFTAQGCAATKSPVPAVTIGAGAVWMDAYHAVTTVAGRYVQGGGCATVGVAGLIQGGGFGSFSKGFGMASGSLLQAEVVTADGAVRTVNACTNPDLFWAIKGGGGGSFGVVTKVTLKTYELPPFFGGVLGDIKANSDAAFRRLIGQFISFYSDKLFNPHWSEHITVHGNNTLGMTMLFQGLDKDQAEKIWSPFLDWVRHSPEDFTISSLMFVSVPAQGWWDAECLRQNPNQFMRDLLVSDPRPNALKSHVWNKTNGGEVGRFMHGYESLWLPASLLEPAQQERLTAALFAGSRHWGIELYFSKGLAGAPAGAIEAARDTPVNPAVLDAFALAIIAGGGPPAYPGFPKPELNAAREHAREIGRSMEELRKVVHTPASYVSESNFFEQSWQEAHWGKNYPRLLSIKKKFDPDCLFFVHHGVGSEEWSADGFNRIL